MSDSVVDMIREKTESGDLDTILKSTLGGYTKKSVLEYIALLKKQKETLREAYEDEITQIREEKIRLEERLHEKESAADDLEKMTEENREMSSRIEELTLEAEELRAEITGLRQELSEQNREIKNLQEEVSQNQEIDILRAEADRLREELEACKKQQEEKDKASEHTAAGKVLFSTIRTRLLEQEEQIAIKEAEIAVLLEEKSILQAKINSDDTLTAENEALAKYLGEEMEKQIVLSRELAKEKALNQVLKKRLAYENY